MMVYVCRMIVYDIYDGIYIYIYVYMVNLSGAWVRFGGMFGVWQPGPLHRSWEVGPVGPCNKGGEDFLDQPGEKEIDLKKEWRDTSKSV